MTSFDQELALEGNESKVPEKTSFGSSSTNVTNGTLEDGAALTELKYSAASAAILQDPLSNQDNSFASWMQQGSSFSSLKNSELPKLQSQLPKSETWDLLDGSKDLNGPFQYDQSADEIHRQLNIPFTPDNTPVTPSLLDHGITPTTTSSISAFSNVLGRHSDESTIADFTSPSKMCFPGASSFSQLAATIGSAGGGMQGRHGVGFPWGDNFDCSDLASSSESYFLSSSAMQNKFANPNSPVSFLSIHGMYGMHDNFGDNLYDHHDDGSLFFSSPGSLKKHSIGGDPAVLAVFGSSSELMSTGEASHYDASPGTGNRTDSVDSSDNEPFLQIKNTFISLQDTHEDIRSRTESADAILLGAADRFHANLKTREKGGLLFDDGYTVFENAEFSPPECATGYRENFIGDNLIDKKESDDNSNIGTHTWRNPNVSGGVANSFPSYPISSNRNASGANSIFANSGQNAEIGIADNNFHRQEKEALNSKARKSWMQLEKEARGALADAAVATYPLNGLVGGIVGDAAVMEDTGVEVVGAIACPSSGSKETTAQTNDLECISHTEPSNFASELQCPEQPPTTGICKTSNTNSEEQIGSAKDQLLAVNLKKLEEESEHLADASVTASKTEQKGTSWPSTHRSRGGNTRHQTSAAAGKLPPGIKLCQIPRSQMPPTDNVKTTIMLRNIPNKYTQKMLLGVIDEEFEGLYDFYYLPIDFRNKCNVGYAFINFTHPFCAEHFRRMFHGFKLNAFKSNKICEVSWGRVQGLKGNIEHYRNSAVMSVPLDQYKPMLFKDGQQIPFPDADGPLPSVKLRPQKC